MTPLVVNSLIGTWLFVSAFISPHPPMQFANAVVCGILAGTFAMAGLQYRSARYLSALLSVWLLFSTLFASATTQAIVWNNTISAIAMLVATLLDKDPEAVRYQRELYARG